MKQCQVIREGERETLMGARRMQRPISVLFVLPNFNAGGAERVMIALMSMLDRQDFAPEIAVFDNQGHFKALLPEDASVHDLRRSRLRSALLPLLKLVRKLKPDIVMSSHSYVSTALLAGRKFLPASTRVVVREPSTPSKSLQDSRYPKIIEAGYRRLYRHADCVICLNQQAESDLIEKFAVPRSRLTMMANPLPVAKLREKASPVARKSGPGRRLVAAGRLAHPKGFDRLLGAMPDTPSDTYLTIYGEGPDEQMLKSLSQRLGIETRVRFAGFEANLAPVLAGADAVVVPSRREGFPNIVLESLACGTPVIISPEAGGAADFLDEVEEGALVVAASPGELARAISSLEVLGATGLRHSLMPERFDEHVVRTQFSELLSRVIERA